MLRTKRFNVLVVGIVSAFAILMGGGSAVGQKPYPFGNRIPVVQDWTHHHVYYSRPSSVTAATRLQQDIRYWYQWFSRNVSNLGGEHGGAGATIFSKTNSDWAMSLGAGASAGAGVFPAKFSFDINAPPDCANDYVAYNTNLQGTSAVSIIAFDNLYESQTGSAGDVCGATGGPQVKWAYATGTSSSGLVGTSIVIAGAGDKIAYVETSNSDGSAVLHILKWKPGSATTVQGTLLAPASPDTVLGSGANWSTCAAASSCLVNLPFGNSANDSRSSPFYDYNNDVLYVGDDTGILHKFTGVFLGAPAEAGGSWPITIHAGHHLTSPTMDTASKNIFVADDVSQFSYVRETGSGSGVCGSGSPPCLGSPANTTQPGTFGAATVDAPLVDGTNGTVFWFSDANQAGHTTCSNGAGVCYGMVTQTDTALGSAVYVNIGGTDAPLGGLGEKLWDGTFDDTYLNSTQGSTSGFLYISGKDPGRRNRRALMRIGFNASGKMNAALDGTPGLNFVDLTSGNGNQSSPLTEIKNGTTDRIFLSVEGGSNFTCAGATSVGCVYSFVISTGAGINAATTPENTARAAGGTSGIVIDNVAPGTNASNIYHSFLNNSSTAVSCNGSTGVGCAVKLTQANLN